MFLVLFIIKSMFFRWGCKNWHVAKLLHPIPTHVNSLGLPRRKYVCREHQWQRLTTVPAEQQTRQREIGSSTLCPVILPTHRRLGNAGEKRTSSKFFQRLMSYTKQRQGMNDTSQRRKVLIHMFWQCQEPHQLGCLNCFIGQGCPENIYLCITTSWKVLLLKTKFL